MNLREIALKRDEIKKEMESLWDKRKDKNWDDKESKRYDFLSGEANKLNKDLKQRAEFETQFKSEADKEDRDFEKSKRDCNIAKIVRKAIFEQKGGSEYKDDYGRTNEVLQEHRRAVNENYVKAGYTPIPDSAFGNALKKRTLTSADGSAGSLIETDVVDSMYAEGLYEKTWAKELGVPMLSGLEGDQQIPTLKSKPAFGWVQEDGTFPNQDIDFANVKLTPLYAGALQIISLGAQIRSKSESAMRFVSMELLNQFRAGLDKSFIQDDGSANTPRGIRSIIAGYNRGSNSLEPDAEESNLKSLVANWNDLLRVEGLIEDTNEMMPLKWLIASKLKRAAQTILKFAVNGSEQLYKNGLFGDTPGYVTNSVPVNLEIPDNAAGYAATIKDAGEASPTQLMSAICIQPASLVIGRWLGGLQLQVSTEGKFFEKGQVAVRVIDVCNLVSRRPSSLAELKNILSFSTLA